MTEYTNRIIYLCRHGQRLDDVHKNWYTKDDNRHDPPLSEQGQLQASLLGMRLIGEPIDHIIVSPYLRAVQTADAIARQLKMDYVLERGVGEWLAKDLARGKPEIPTPELRYDEFPRVLANYESLIVPEYPETVANVLGRMKDIVYKLMDTHDGNLLIVGHGRTVTGISVGLTGQQEKNFSYGHACITKLVFDGKKWQVELNGDTSHLQQQPMIV